jgi:hypothetical protein
MKPSNEPDLMRLYLRHCAVGFGLSAVFVSALLWFDIARIGTLVAGSDIGWLAVFLLWFFHGTVFGSVQFAVTIMLNADDDDDEPRGGMMIPVRAAAPARTADRRI